jgi:hypothetical protein
MVLPPRTGWRPDFPDVVIHATLPARNAHPLYAAAKAGDAPAALILALDLLCENATGHLGDLVGGAGAILLPVTALEFAGFNAIPDAMAQILAKKLDWRVSVGDIVQSNEVGHTRARAFNRLVTPAAFEGPVRPEVDYVLVDDHIGLGGTLANLKGYIETNGGRVVAMSTLTESREARRIALQDDVHSMLKERHGEGLENLWKEHFGYGLECLTNVEAGILCREQTLESIRDRLAQAAGEARIRGLVPGIEIASLN